MLYNTFLTPVNWTFLRVQGEDTSEYKLYEDYEDGTENISMSGGSDNSDDDDQFNFGRNGDYYGNSSNKEGMGELS